MYTSLSELITLVALSSGDDLKSILHLDHNGDLHPAGPGGAPVGRDAGANRQ